MDFKDLACWPIVQIGPISINVTTPQTHTSRVKLRRASARRNEPSTIFVLAAKNAKSTAE